MQTFDYYFMGMHLAWWLVWALLLVPVVIFRRVSRRRVGQTYQNDPLGILQRRLAEGRITAPEYEERRMIILRDRASPSGAAGG